MFSNGTEYDIFMERNCESCPFYVHFEDSTPEKPVCNIEERIALCSILETAEAIQTFPYEWLDKNTTSSVYTCRKRLGKKLKFKTVDNLPKYNTEPPTSEELNNMFKNLTK